MSSPAGRVTAFFADRDRDFSLGIGEAQDLERVRFEDLRKMGCEPGSASVMAIFIRLVSDAWLDGDVRTTLYLALVGEGEERAAARSIVDAGLKPGGMGAAAVLAASILQRYLTGDPNDRPGDQPGKAKARPGTTRRASRTASRAGAGSTARAPS